MLAIWLPSKWYQEPSGSLISQPTRSASGSLDSTTPLPFASAKARAGSVDCGTSGLGERKGITANEPSGPSAGGVSTGKPILVETSPAVLRPTPHSGVYTTGRSWRGGKNPS